MTALPPEVEAARAAVAEARRFEESAWRLRIGVAEGWLAALLLGTAFLSLPHDLIFLGAMFGVAFYFEASKRWRGVWKEQDVWNWKDLTVLIFFPLVFKFPAGLLMSTLANGGLVAWEYALRSVPFLGLVGYGLAVGFVGRRRQDPFEIGVGLGMMVIGAAALWRPLSTSDADFVVAAAFVPLLGLALVRIVNAVRSMGGSASRTN